MFHDVPCRAPQWISFFFREFFVFRPGFYFRISYFKPRAGRNGNSWNLCWKMFSNPFWKCIFMSLTGTRLMLVRLRDLWEMICLAWVSVESSELSKTGEERWALNLNACMRSLLSLKTFPMVEPVHRANERQIW